MNQKKGSHREPWAHLPCVAWSCSVSLAKQELRREGRDNLTSQVVLVVARFHFPCDGFFSFFFVFF